MAIIMAIIYRIRAITKENRVKAEENYTSISQVNEFIADFIGLFNIKKIEIEVI